MDATEVPTSNASRSSVAAAGEGAWAVDELARGMVVDRYVLLDRLGDGAMGVVHAAFDRDLDRKVALKLLKPGVGGSSAGQQALMIREAQALARLSHPNVVGVHDVGTHAGRVWIAMELVGGRTLRAWASEQRRTWQEVLAVLIEAARGVAAAHAVGLVHRDIKPDNVMIDAEGRVRVMDFGLAHGRAGTNRAEPASPALSSSLSGLAVRAMEAVQAVVRPQAGSGAKPAVGQPTMAQSVVAAFDATVAGDDVRPEVAALGLRLTHEDGVPGTPAYNAPELWSGREANAWTDQFGWSVMAWELLYGTRPFAGATLMALMQAIVGDERAPAPRGARVPGWLRAAIERGMAPVPEQRWPSMTALLTVLERGRVRPWVRKGLLLAAGVLAIGAGLVVRERWAEARQVRACAAAGAEIEGVWNEAVAAAVGDAFAASGSEHAATAARGVAPWLDREAAQWRSARTEACLAVEVRGEWTRALGEQALWCLADRQLALQSLIDEFRRADAATVYRAIQSASSLGAGVRVGCLDVGQLQRSPAPPAGDRTELLAIRGALAEARAKQYVGRYADALARVRGAAARAEQAFAWAPLQADALRLEASLRRDLGEYAAAEATATTAYFFAASHEAWSVAAHAASDLSYMTGGVRARADDGRLWSRHAAFATELAGDPTGLMEAMRLSNLASVEFKAGDLRAARDLARRAVELQTRVLGPDHPHLCSGLMTLANALAGLGAEAEALTIYERVLALREATLGVDHPSYAAALHNLADTYFNLNDTARAQVLFERAVALWDKFLGPDHPSVAAGLDSLARLYEFTGQYSRARALYTRLLAIRERAAEPQTELVVQCLGNLGNVLLESERYDEAAAAFERVRDVCAATLGPDNPLYADSLVGVALARAGLGQPAEALALAERGLAIHEAALGREDAELAWDLDVLAALHLAAGRVSDARRLAERSLGLRAYGVDIDDAALADSVIGLAAVHAAAGDPAEARRLYAYALPLYERARGPEHPRVGVVLLGLGRSYVREGEPAAAMPSLERAWALYAGRDDDLRGELDVRFALAEALVATGGDRARAVREAKLARAGLLAVGASTAEIEGWLVKQAPD